MRHTSRKRSRYDPLRPLNEPTWLVVRSQTGFVLDSHKLAPGADLRAILMAARDTRIARGWMADDIGVCCSFFFSRLGSERVITGIERIPPQDPLGCPDCG